MIFCMTSEVSGNHILTNSRNTSWRYLKTPFLFIPSQNGWWSCPSKLEVIQVFPIFFFNFKDLIILSVCSDVFLYLSLSLYIYIYIGCFFEQMAKKAPEIFAESEQSGLQVSSVPAPPWRCCAAGKMTILLLVGRLEEGNQFQKIPICYLGGGFKICLIFTPIWGRFPFWLIFFRWVETTNQLFVFMPIGSTCSIKINQMFYEMISHNWIVVRPWYTRNNQGVSFSLLSWFRVNIPYMEHLG